MLKRDLPGLANKVYDLVIIGGGIYGTSLAWEASLRGLTVALVEKTDFGAATSANSLKIIHGGLRYLQHADFKRARESIGERRTLLRIAPHLIHPIPILVPTYGHGMKGKEAFALGLAINDLIGFDRNHLDDPQKHIPRSHIISKQECQQLLPYIPRQDLTGGALFYDAQVYNSERLPLAFLMSAAHTGADLANYVEVTGFLQKNGCVTGVHAKDALAGDQFEIQARTVVNTSGPWIDNVLGLLNGKQPLSKIRLAKAINVMTHSLFETYAVGMSGRTCYEDSDAVIKKGSRFYFIAPWRSQSLIGTEYIPYTGHPDNFEITEKEIEKFLAEINQVYPAAGLKREDITYIHAGLVPIAGVDSTTGSVQLAKHYQILDYRQQGLDGLFSIVGVKYTTARYVAEKMVDRLLVVRGRKPIPSTSAVTPLYGGQIDRFETFLSDEIDKQLYGLDEGILRKLIYNYGSVYPDVLHYHTRNGDHQSKSDYLDVLRAETLYGIHQEMAQKLADIVFRRTELGTAGHPGDEAIALCARVMGENLGWNTSKIRQEIQEVNTVFSKIDGTKLAGQII